MSSNNQSIPRTTRSMSRASNRASSVDSVAMSTRNRATTPRGVRSSSRRPQVQAQQSFAYGSVGQPLGAPDLHAQTALETTETALEIGIQTSVAREAPRQNMDENALSAIQEEEEHRSTPGSDEVGDIPTNLGAGAFRGSRNAQVAVKSEQEEIQGGVEIQEQPRHHSAAPSNQPQTGVSRASSFWYTCKWCAPIFSAVSFIILFLSMMNLEDAGYLSFFHLHPRAITNISVDAWDSNTLVVDSLTQRLDSLTTNLNSYTYRLEALESWTRSLSNSQPTIAMQPKVHKVNYFSTGLGAVVDPWLTSPTKPAKLVHTYEAGLVSRLFGWNTIVLREAFAPVEALGPWQDIGDCWCAPPAKGKAQLGVILPRNIVPTELVIENIPRDATLDIGAAPKDIEMWVQINDPQGREAVENAAFAIQPDGGSALEARDYHVKALDETWVRVGKWRYDIFADEHVQTFPIPIDLDHFGVRVNKVVVRAKANWGDRDYVCLYRLRLHGLLREDDPMYQDSAPIQTTTIIGE